MKQSVSRRQFLQASAVAGAGLALPKELLASKKKSVLIFTKSSGFEHEVIKVTAGNPASSKKRSRLWASSMALTSPPPRTAASSIPPTSEKYSAVLFFTTLDLTKTGTDGNPPMSPAGKQALLDAIHGGIGLCRSSCRC